jgi:hypothetical protein
MQPMLEQIRVTLSITGELIKWEKREERWRDSWEILTSLNETRGRESEDKDNNGLSLLA